MTALDIQSKEDMLQYLNENPHETDIEIADVELSGVCTIKDLQWPYGEVKSIEVELVSLNEIPAKWFHHGIIALAEAKLAVHEDILVDVRSTVQYVLDIQQESKGDYTGGDAIDEAYEAERDRRLEAEHRRIAI